ncbi:MAG: hypothetical protein AAF821_24630 [Cyanobacteria bacterium P01_D01_bin.156]
MGLFDSSPSTKISLEQLKQLKGWVYQTLSLDEGVPLSISQLTCTEPGCPPLETVIAIMTQPPQTYKIHQPASEITADDIVQTLTKKVTTDCCDS